MRFLKDFRYDHLSTFPILILTIPLTEAISYIILNTPVNVIHAS